MTRINVISVRDLCDQHLLAEHRELTRIPNRILSKGMRIVKDIPEQYVLGSGHMKFFYDKMTFLHNRYIELHEECIARGFNVQFLWPSQIMTDSQFTRLWKNYTPTTEAKHLNVLRLAERMPYHARYTRHKQDIF